MEFVGQGILGHSFDPLVSDDLDEYAKAFNDLIYVSSRAILLLPQMLITVQWIVTSPATLGAQIWVLLVPFLDYLGPAWFRRRLLDAVPISSLQRIKKVCDTLYNKAKEILEAKKAAIAGGDQELLHTIGEGRDMMSLLRKRSAAPSRWLSLTAFQSRRT